LKVRKKQQTLALSLILNYMREQSHKAAVGNPPKGKAGLEHSGPLFV